MAQGAVLESTTAHMAGSISKITRLWGLKGLGSADARRIANTTNIQVELHKKSHVYNQTCNPPAAQVSGGSYSPTCNLQCSSCESFCGRVGTVHRTQHAQAMNLLGIQRLCMHEFPKFQPLFHVHHMQTKFLQLLCLSTSPKQIPQCGPVPSSQGSKRRGPGLCRWFVVM